MGNKTSKSVVTMALLYVPYGGMPSYVHSLEQSLLGIESLCFRRNVEQGALVFSYQGAY